MKTLKSLEDILFNKTLTCQLCAREVFDGEYFCKRCENQLSPLTSGNICGKCGRKTDGEYPFCLACKSEKVYFDLARSAFDFSGGIEKLIYAFKDGACVYLDEIFAKYMLPLFSRYFFKAQLIVPVPASEEDIIRRGFSHALFISQKLANMTGVELNLDALVKLDGFSPQKQLNKKQRFLNADKMYRLKKRALFKDKTVLIIDDVMTTGATANAISQKLKNAGAAQVYVLTFASVAV